MATYVNVARSCFSKFSFLFHLKDHYTKDVNFEFQLNRSNRLDVASDFVHCSCYILLCKINSSATSHTDVSVKYAFREKRL